MVKKYNLDLLKKVEIFVILLILLYIYKIIGYIKLVNNKINHIDVDKIDYILRDSYHIGLFHNDFSRILTMIKVLYFNKSLVLACMKNQHDIYLLFCVDIDFINKFIIIIQ